MVVRTTLQRSLMTPGWRCLRNDPYHLCQGDQGARGHSSAQERQRMKRASQPKLSALQGGTCLFQSFSICFPGGFTFETLLNTFRLSDVACV